MLAYIGFGLLVAIGVIALLCIGLVAILACIAPHEPWNEP